MNEVTIFEAKKEPEQPKPSRRESAQTTNTPGAKVDPAPEVGVESEVLPVNPIKFYGQHEDERILCEVHPAPILRILIFIRYAFFGLMVWVVTIIIGRIVPNLLGVLGPIGFIVGAIAMLIGWWIVQRGRKHNVAYITDRRIVRFRAIGPWSVSNRSLSWDEVVKVKTFSLSLILRSFNIGTVVIHAGSTVLPVGTVTGPMGYLADDDIHLEGVHYYQDLGNYLDKILYLYKQRPAELQTMRAFVAKPRGQRD
jgi:hypothetical protein